MRQLFQSKTFWLAGNGLFCLTNLWYALNGNTSSYLFAAFSVLAFIAIAGEA